MRVDYSTVSLERKQLRERLKIDNHLSQIIKRVEADLSIIFDPQFLMLCYLSDATSIDCICFLTQNTCKDKTHERKEARFTDYCAILFQR